MFSYLRAVPVALLLTAAAAPAATDSLTTFPQGKAVNPGDLEFTLCTTWVEWQGIDAATLSLWDIDLRIEPGSRLLLGASSDYIYALTLGGKLTSMGKSASPGQILVWNHFGENQGKPVPYSFSAERLGEVFASKGEPNDTDLGRIAKSQKRKRFWGLLRPTGFDVASPGGLALENLRRNYQTHPEIIRIKRDSRSRADYARKTVEAFIMALHLGDARTAALLLSPELFAVDASVITFERLLTEERLAFARHLIASGDYQKLGAWGVRETGGDEFLLTLNDRLFRVSLEAFDDGLYVSSLQPE